MAKISFSRISLLVLALLLVFATSQVSHTEQQLRDLFEQWKIAFHKSYPDTQQQQHRFQIWKDNLLEVELANNPAWGLTKFSDKTEAQLGGYKGLLNSQESQAANTPRRLLVDESGPIPKPQSELPKTFDWRTYKVVTQVKSQGECGNCWAFSTTAFFESQLARRNITNNKVDLAQQFFLQCDEKSDGCDGGYLTTAMDLGLFKGIPYEAQFPWSPLARYGGICTSTLVASLSGSNRVSYYNGLSDSQIKTLLLQRPLNIAVAAKNWRLYAPGSSKTYKCLPTQSTYNSLDHTVLLVGWTETEWIIKNQWGTDWGVSGYIYVSMSDSEDCGIGYEVHTLNYKLPEVSIVESFGITTTTITAAPTIQLTSTNPKVVAEVPVALNCTLSNCQTCYFNSPTCIVCKEGYQLNSKTKFCEPSKIDYCVEFTVWAGFYQCLVCQKGYTLQEGACAAPGLNPPVIKANIVNIVDPFAKIPADYYTKNKDCTLNFCQVCYDNGQKCLTCFEGWAVNQVTDECEKTPIEGCNLFLKVKDTAACFECRKGYTLRGHSACDAPLNTTSSVSGN